MQLRCVDVVEDISADEFKKKYFEPKVPDGIKKQFDRRQIKEHLEFGGNVQHWYATEKSHSA